MASSMPLAATGGLEKMSMMGCRQSHEYPHGTNMAEAVAPVSRTASLTFAKTGFPKCVSPAFFGFVPPTTFVPGDCQCAIFPGGGGFLNTIFNCLLRVKTILRLALPELKSSFRESPPALLAREALKDHFGVAVNTEIL